MSEDPDAVVKEVSEACDLKSVKPVTIPGRKVPWESPNSYLGADVGFDAERQCWCMGAQTYIENSLKTIQSKLEEKGLVLNKSASSPCPLNYRPELDMSEHLDSSGHQFFQQLIGVLNWTVERGRIEIHNSVARLSARLAAPRVGGFACVLTFDPTMPPLPADYNKQHNWERFCPDAKLIDEKRPKMPEPLGSPMRMNCFVDADHAGDQATQRPCARKCGPTPTSTRLIGCRWKQH